MNLAVWILAAQAPLGMGHLEYRFELVRIATLLANGEVPTAQSAAQALLGTPVVGPVPFIADASVLKPVVELKAGESPAPLIARLQAASAGLETEGPPRAPGDSDLQSLQSIRESWDLELQEGRADLHLPRTRSPPEWLINRVADVLSTLERWARALFKALFGRELKAAEKGIGAAEGTLALVALACGLFAVLAYRAYRSRRRESALDLPEVATPSDRDEDPTSRQPSEWEQHAEALARSGRYREAIRAWYHAVLAATFRRGYVTYAKGRTNWEYVAALSPGLRFRNDVIAMTERFEGCWYGGRDASPAVLAEQKIAARAVLAALSAGGPG